MNKKLSDITDCLSQQMLCFEQMFLESLNSGNKTLDTVLAYVSSAKGKRIRPLLTFLTAGIFGKITDQTYRSAVIIELLHTASLLHDDVVDSSKIRHGKQTINAVFGDKTAILTGDYIYGKVLATIKTEEDFMLMDVFSRIAMQLPLGEIQESDVTDKKSFDTNSYFDVIYYKTASLISAAVECGARSCKNKDLDIPSLALLGKNIGLAFQIQDDILDYYTDNTSGKGFGNDIYEEKITLPLIYCLETLDEKGKEELLQDFFAKNKTKQQVESIINRVKNSGALQKAGQVQKKYSADALKTIDSMPLCEYSVTLRELVEFLITRKY